MLDFVEIQEQPYYSPQPIVVHARGGIGEKIRIMWEEVERKSTPAGVLAKDAEILEMAFTARELVFKGNATAQAWIDAVGVRLKSQSGLEFIQQLNSSNPQHWWRNFLGYTKDAPIDGTHDLPLGR